MSFGRHGEIFSDGRQIEGPKATRKPLPAQRRNEFPVGYSLAGCSPAEPTSASPTACQCQSEVFGSREILSQRYTVSYLFVSPQGASPRLSLPLSYRAPAGRQTVARGGRSSGPPSPLVPPWVSVFTICSPSPNTYFVLGERAGVRGKTRLTCNDYASCQETFEHNETRDSLPGNKWPPSPDLSPRITQERVIRGERRRMGRNAVPGRRERLLPSLALG